MLALITGISGRIGANLAAQLLQRGYTVRGLVMPGDPKLGKVQGLGVEVIEAEIGNAEAVYRAVDGADVVAHLAAQMKQGQSTEQRMFEINALGTLNILEGARRSSKRPQSVLLASTDQTYHPFVTERTTFYENHIQQPIDLYALTKVMSEQMFFTYQREFNLPIKIIRYSSVLAAAEALEVLRPAWLDAFINGEWTMPGRVPWFGAEQLAAAKQAVTAALNVPNAACGITDAYGSPWGLPFTDVRDSVAATLLMLDSPAAIGEVFNAVAPASTSFVDAAKLIAAHTDRPYLEVRLPFLWWFGVANDKARSVLGYDPKYNFADMVESAVAFRRGEDIGVVPV